MLHPGEYRAVTNALTHDRHLLHNAGGQYHHTTTAIDTASKCQEVEMCSDGVSSRNVLLDQAWYGVCTLRSLQDSLCLT